MARVSKNGGSFVHFDNNPALPIPKPILGTGTWKARRLLNLDLIGTWGVFAAGTVEMEINLVPDNGPVMRAILEMNCNLGFAGLLTGKAEEGERGDNSQSMAGFARVIATIPTRR